MELRTLSRSTSRPLSNGSIKSSQELIDSLRADRSRGCAPALRGRPQPCAMNGRRWRRQSLGLRECGSWDMGRSNGGSSLNALAAVTSFI